MGPLLADSEEIGDFNEADGDTVDVRAHFGSGLMPTPTFGFSCWQGSYFHVRIAQTASFGHRVSSSASANRPASTAWLTC